MFGGCTSCRFSVSKNVLEQILFLLLCPAYITVRVLVLSRCMHNCTSISYSMCIGKPLNICDAKCPEDFKTSGSHHKDYMQK